MSLNQTIRSIEHAGIMQAILAEPADDLPRLAYADQCEENGQIARTEFIRIQLELDKTEDSRICEWDSRPDCSCRPCVLKQRERELIHLTGFWGADVPLPVIPANGWCAWSRGFISAIRCSQKEWLEYGPAIVRMQPIERVGLSDKQPWSSSFATHKDFLEEHGSVMLHTIDRRIMKWMNGGPLGGKQQLPSGPYFCAYLQNEDWQADLSNACLLFARQPP